MVWKPHAQTLSRRSLKLQSVPAATYSAEWMATFGSIDDPTFSAPERVLPSAAEPFDSES
jgi:hypothetical protein